MQIVRSHRCGSTLMFFLENRSTNGGNIREIANCLSIGSVTTHRNNGANSRNCKTINSSVSSITTRSTNGVNSREIANCLSIGSVTTRRNNGANSRNCKTISSSVSSITTRSITGVNSRNMCLQLVYDLLSSVTRKGSMCLQLVNDIGLERLICCSLYIGL